MTDPVILRQIQFAGATPSAEIVHHRFRVVISQHAVGAIFAIAARNAADMFVAIAEHMAKLVTYDPGLAEAGGEEIWPDIKHPPPCRIVGEKCGCNKGLVAAQKLNLEGRIGGLCDFADG